MNDQMQKALFTVRPNSKGYMMDQANGNTIHYLGYCITDLWLERLNEYIEWAYDSDRWFMALNVATLEKEDDYILIGSQLSDQEDGGPFYKISIAEFVKLLPQWKKLVDERVQEITITDTDGHIEISGS